MNDTSKKGNGKEIPGRVASTHCPRVLSLKYRSPNIPFTNAKDATTGLKTTLAESAPAVLPNTYSVELIARSAARASFAAADGSAIQRYPVRVRREQESIRL